MNDALFPFWDPVRFWWLPLLAFVLDRIVGDPPHLPHPVRLIGAWLKRIEKPLRTLPLFWGGVLGVVFTLEAACLAAAFPLRLPGAFALAAALYLCVSGLALGQLVREGERARKLLADNDIDAARVAVGYLVSRDVSRADGEELGRVLAESLGENFTDGFVAPYFWLLLGGPVALWMYKAVSTMDSMWGYPHEPWTLFGRAAARCDDALAFVPARLAALFLWLAVWLGRKADRPWALRGIWPGYATFRAQALSMKSPNAGWSMAMTAWMQGRRMGGPAIYNGQTVLKPVLGPENGDWDAPSLAALVNHLQAAAVVGAVSLSAFFAAVYFVLF